VRYGYRLGRTLGTPTINMSFSENVLVPAFGVYASRVYLCDAPIRAGREDGYTGVTNIGTRPTVGNSGHITAETHILDYQSNLYGRKVRIEFYKHLRPEIKFRDTDELKGQIRQDCETARQYFDKVPNSYWSEPVKKL